MESADAFDRPDGSSPESRHATVQDGPPEEFENPSGVGRGECDTAEDSGQDDSCDLEITAEVRDLVMGETMPGSGIAGYDAEEGGGG
jgi:hypothetical protein